MAIGKLARGGLAGFLLRWASGLRFPYLFLLTALLFIFNLFVPDVVPVVDELIMGLAAMTLASFRKKPDEERNDKSPPEAIEVDKVEGE
jgi:Family of unknown function (DUF6116)